MGWKTQVIITSLITLYAIVLENSVTSSSPSEGGIGEVDDTSPENIDKELEKLQKELDELQKEHEFRVKKEELLALKEKITHLKEDSPKKEPLIDETKEQLRHQKERFHTISDPQSQSESESPHTSKESDGSLDKLQKKSSRQDQSSNLDMTACLNELNLADEMQKNVESHVRKYGMRGLDALLKEHLSEYENSKVSIAVTGESGAGKSTLINTIRNLKPNDEGSAKVGITETTKEPTPYSFPNLPNIILWDLPGMDGSTTFSKDRYMENVKLASYDALLIVCSGRFKQNDIWIAKRAEENKIPFYLIRTKINVDFDNVRKDNPDHDETELLQILRIDLESQLEEHGLETSKIFLVSGRLEHYTLWDFSGLMKSLTQHTPGKKREALAVAISSSSNDIIQMKKNHCEGRIDEVALQVAASDDMITTLMKEINSYSDIFGISADDQIKWKTKFENLNNRNQKIMQLLNDVSNELEEKSKAKVNVDDQTAGFELIETVFGGGLGTLTWTLVGPWGTLAGAVTGLILDATYYYRENQQIAESRKQLTKRIEELEDKKKIAGSNKELMADDIIKEVKLTLREILDHVVHLSIEILNESIESENIDRLIMIT